MLAAMHLEEEKTAEPANADATTEPDEALPSDDVPELPLEDSVSPAATANETDLSTAPNETEHANATNDADPDAAALSPSVRRLVRQYDLDITGIHGTGPAGRIKVGDVMALLGGRGEAPQARPSDPARTIPAVEDAAEERTRTTPYRSAASAVALPQAATSGASATTIFECDLTRVLAHRKRQSDERADVAVTSYYLVACSEALRLVPEAAPAGTALGVVLSTPDGQARSVLVEREDSALESINDRLLGVDRALRAPDARASLRRAAIVLHHHGLSGSLIATPTPVVDGHAASIGLGRVRKQIVVRTIDGEDVPRVAAVAYVSLSFLPDRLDLQRANRFLAHFVRVLEQWPE